MKDSISIIIPSYNSSRTVSYTLDAIIQLKGNEYIKEVIVVDSSDDKKTNTLLKQYESEIIKIISLDRKTIPAIARNIGASEASGDILAFIDSDAYPEKNWVFEIVQACKDEIKVGGGSISLPYFQRKGVLAWAQLFLQFNEYLDCGKIEQKKFAPSCNLFCIKKLFLEVGGFPKIRAAEDVLFGFAVSQHATLFFLPGIRVYHIFEASWKRLFFNQILLHKYNIIYRKKHYDSLLYKGVFPIIATPVFVFVKFVNIFRRVMNTNWRYFFYFLYVLPIVLVSMMFCGIGFLKGCMCSYEEDL